MLEFALTAAAVAAGCVFALSYIAVMRERPETESRNNWRLFYVSGWLIALAGWGSLLITYLTT